MQIAEDFAYLLAGASPAYVTDSASLPSITELPSQAKPVGSRGKAASIGPVFLEGGGEAITRVIPGYMLSAGVATMNSLKDMRGAMNR
ncbi:hypothetical protein SA496_07675 [Pseudomonas sp. JS3066]|jgi:hypothetical protein|uniref:hypothetical protein n=1 Tax=unclassified Pseudomonas TaxID=196821 RepID=UPI000EAA5E73|nr:MULTISPECIES: hypothetical protein [unclassified Pseudomonas]AYF87431.1 hypothetical protein D6Z43_09805 [Pseudomonas sp. DY-1]MDH4656666.1 hypothetical protein [Pseudomonas sp. BN606]MRK23064.1 hypothetical protein [Pseudomonas sp. JG-B]WVK95041.1 hypothetical protein SA496_07675 [Pseudomonas sp. JS3066]